MTSWRATAALPWLLVLSLFRVRELQRPWVQHAIVAVAGAGLALEACVQYFFFEECSARYNHLALDYLLYPDEVFGNIFASYNVPLFVGLAVVVGMALALVTRWWPRVVVNDWRWRDRLKGLAFTGCLALIAGGAWLFVPDHVVGGRVANELAINGWAQLVRAYLTAHLDYEAYYATLPADDASPHLRQLLSQSNGSGGLLRHFESRRHGTDDPMDAVPLFSDLLLHDVGTGGGIAQGAALPEEIRTPALWGLRLRRPLLHDGRAATIEDALRGHRDEAELAVRGFAQLSRDEKARVLSFLRSL